MSENNYCRDFWGGTHCINKNDGTYYLTRDCGLFSNLTVSTYAILQFTLDGYTPKNISLKLLEYDLNNNYYPDLFKINDTHFTVDDIDKIIMDYQMRFCEPSHIGIGRAKSHLNFEILNRIYGKYFTPSDVVINYINEFEKKHNINYSNSVFIWARKTDKEEETTVPDVDDYIKLVNDLNLSNKDIILQTDDIGVYNEFMSKKINCRVLNEIPYSNELNKGFHQHLYLINDETFQDNHNMSKKEYLQKILALTHIAAKCENVIIYPGNLATYIPILRGNWVNVHSYINKDNFLPE